MARVTQDEVRSIIDADDSVSMTPFITMATNLTDRISAKDSGSLLDAGDLKDIELNLAAHSYEMKDPQVKTESTDGASSTYQGQWGKLFERTSWGQMALVLDATGYLRMLQDGGKQTLSTAFLGKAPSAQTDYVDRD